VHAARRARSRLRAALACAALALAGAASVVAAQPVEPLPCDAKAGPCWLPALGARWQYQLEAKRGREATGGIDVGICAKPPGGGACVTPDVFDVDLWVDPRLTDGAAVVNEAAVAAIHAAGKRAVCYVQAGTAGASGRTTRSSSPSTTRAAAA
jgi:Glycoside-hydrolase family GH114